MINLSEIWGAIQDRVVELIHRTEARGCWVYRSSAQSINNSALTAISFDVETVDTDGCWAVGSPTQLTAQRDGYYLAGGSWSLAAASVTASARMLILVRVNGALQVAIGDQHLNSGYAASVSVASGPIWLAAGDYVELMVLHNIGAAKNLVANSGNEMHYNNGWLVRVS